MTSNVSEPPRLGYVKICLTDHAMDRRGNFDQPLNALPRKCSYCHFVDLDFVPQPYYLGKGIARSCEIDVAELGNFFVRERARAVIQVVCPDQCDFYPTVDFKSKALTPWSLAVPRSTISVADVKATIPRCPECGEAKAAHWGSQCEHHFPESIETDIAKSLNWNSGEQIGEEAGWYYRHVLKLKDRPNSPPHQWTRVTLGRWLFFSVRLELLLKKLGIKGVVRTLGWEAQPTESDTGWVNQQLERLAELGLATAKPSAESATVDSWFQIYLKTNSKKRKTRPDFDKVERLLEKPLPPSYKRFISEVGPKMFRNVDDEERIRRQAAATKPTQHFGVSPRRNRIRRRGEYEDRRSRLRDNRFWRRVLLRS